MKAFSTFAHDCITDFSPSINKNESTHGLKSTIQYTFNLIETNRLRLVRWNEDIFQAILNDNLVKLGEVLNCETPLVMVIFGDLS